MIVNGKDIPESSLLEDNDGKKKCLSEWQSVHKKNKINLEMTGDKKTNALLAFLKCQQKAKKSSGAANTSTCQAEEREYTSCHQSFMGVGSYKGKKHCGDPLGDLFNCILSGAENA